MGLKYLHETLRHVMQTTYATAFNFDKAQKK